MDLKQIGSAASITETVIHRNKMASCSVEIRITAHLQEIVKSTLHISLMSCIIHSSDMGL